jgi:hypothetical protein
MKRRSLLVALLWLFASGALAQYPAVKNTAGEVKRDADFNKPGAAKPSGNTVRAPMQQGQVQRDSDWNSRSRNVFTPPLSFVGDAGPSGAATPHGPFTTPALSFVGAAPATGRSVHISTGKLDFIGAAEGQMTPAAGRDP